MISSPESKTGYRRFGVAGLLLLLLVSAVAVPGCGPPGSYGEAPYRLLMNGEEVGGQTVDVQRTGESVAYTGEEKRPYLVYDTAAYMEIVVSEDRDTLIDYHCECSRNGVAFDTHLSRSEPGGSYEYLRDELHTFEFYEGISGELGLMPFEPDSACTLQLLLDRWSLSGEEELNTWSVVPSRNVAIRETTIRAEGDGRVRVKVEGVGDFEADYDRDTGRLVKMTDRSAGTVIEMGDPGRLSSRPYAESQGVVEEVRVPTVDGLELAGSLYLPACDPPHKAAVLVSGDGPNDRTGGGFLSQLAQELADQGIAALTCDKRGVPDSEGDYGRITLELDVNDLNSQVEYLFLRGDVDPDRIFVVAHGGGGVPAVVTATVNPYVSALVLMAVPSVRLFQDLALQHIEEAGARGELSQGEVDIMKANVDEQVRVIEEVDGDIITVSGQNVFLGWMRSYMETDQLEIAGDLAIPVLLVQGEQDELTKPEQADQLLGALEARGVSTQELVTFDDLGHEFGEMVGEVKSRPFRSHPDVEGVVMDTVAGWLNDRR